MQNHHQLPHGRIRNRPLKDYAGQKFGRLTAVRLIERDWKLNNHIWLFSCDCGKTVETRIKQATSGHTKSCGCLQKEVLVARNTVHGLSKLHPRAYRTWKDMRGRCLTATDSDYADYGGRGIKVCDAWNDFSVFIRDMGDRPIGCTLDRIDVDGDYEPSNCRWATNTEQARNRRSNHVIEYDGQRKTLAEWSKQFEVEPSKVRYRLAAGWPLDLAFSKEDFRRAGSDN